MQRSSSDLEDLELEEITTPHQPTNILLPKLIERTEQEQTAPVWWYQCIKGISVVIGYGSAYIYWYPTLRAAKNAPKPILYSALAGTVGSNANDNAFFNLDMARDLFYLLTKQWSASKLELFFNFVMSFLSSLPFACMDIKDLFEKGPAFAYPMLIMLVTVYSAQHYFSILRMVRLFCREKAMPEAVAAKKALLARIKGITLQLEDDKIPTNNLNFRSIYPFNINNQGKNQGKSLNVIELARIINSFPYSSLAPEAKSCCRGSCWKGGAQLIGFGIQLIANVGYLDSTIKGMEELLSVDFPAALILASVCMIPIYGLGFILSYETVNTLFDFFGSLLPKIYHCRFNEIRDEVPYSMRKAPVFSSVASAVLLYLAVFSPFTGVSLLDQAIYDSDGNFGFLDDAEQTGRIYYISITAIGTIIFNAFPVFPLVAYLSKIYCNRFKDSAIRDTLRITQILNELYEKVNRISAEEFTQEDMKSLPTPKETNCRSVRTFFGDCFIAVSSCISSLFCCTRSRPPKEKHVWSNGGWTIPSKVESKNGVLSRPSSPDPLEEGDGDGYVLLLNGNK